MTGIKIRGLKEYQEKFKQVSKNAPGRIIKKADEIGEEIKEEAKEDAPVLTGNLKAGFNTKPAVKRGTRYKKTIFNNARHAHLIEKGHRLVKGGRLGSGGRVIGWVDGFFMLEKANDKFDMKIGPELSRWLDELYKEFD